MDIPKVEHAVNRLKEISEQMAAILDRKETASPETQRRWSLAMALNVNVIRRELNLVAATTSEAEPTDLR